MERKTQINGLINLLALVLIGGTAVAVAKYGNTLAGLTACVFLGIGALVAAVSWFQMRLEERERLEKLEFEELTKSAASSALFTSGETEVFPAQRSREQFERFFVPIFTVVLFVLQAGGAVLLWRWLGKSLPTAFAKPTVPITLFALFALILFILGKYSTSVARLEKSRLLRPAASYLLLCAYICFAVAAGIAAVMLDFPQVDLNVAKVLTVVLMLTGVETLINLILELYRPRVKGRVERPVYESRVVSVMGQPEGLLTTATQTLDYQFGFNVSETWAYRLLKEWLAWLILAQLLVLLLSSCLVFIESGTEGLLERNGRPIAVLKPGLSFKLPWPISRVYRYATQQIQTINVGFTPDESPTAGNTVLWTVPHSKEENFLVANRQLPVVGNTNGPADNRPPPVSLLTVSIPIQFQITNLTAWVYNNEDPTSLLSDLATREVVRYFVSVDLGEIMSKKRWDAAQTLRDRIQGETDAHNMGASIVFVGLQDIHPPQKVAADYEKVVTAVDVKEAAILDARAYAIASTNVADAQSFKTISEANSESLRLKIDALANAALFTNQIPAYAAAPSVYVHRAFLQTFAQSVTNARSYVLLATNTQDVLILDLEDKIRKDILEAATLPVPKTPIPAVK